MKKRKCIITVGAFMVVLLSAISFIFVVRNSKITSYEYQVDDTMDAGMILHVCRIPDETLNRMTDEALAQAVADFPLLIDVEVAHSTAYGVEWLAENSDAYGELLTRPDAKNVLIEQIKKLYDMSNMENYIKATVLKDVVLNERSFQKILTEQEIEYLNSIK